MRVAFNIIQRAFADCGYWRWWTAKLPETFQAEFGGVQLYQQPSDASRSPSGVFALRFELPKRVQFLQFTKGAERNWFLQLQGDKFKPPSLDQEHFFLGDDKAIERLRRQAIRTYDHFTSAKAGGSVRFSFKTNIGVGLFVMADRVRLFSHTGEISLKSVAKLHGDWWDYWHKYWRLKDTGDALPEDYACEVCIPAGDD